MGFFFTDFGVISGFGTQYRILSVSDVEGGSIGTRFLWYSDVWAKIIESDFIGGFGAGSHEIVTRGYLMHFEILRFWYDYSIFVLCFLVALIYIYAIGFDFVSGLIYFVVVFLLPAFHNFLQAPDLNLLVACAVGVGGPAFEWSYRVRRGVLTDGRL